MSQGPSTFGSMMTSSLLPAAATISRRRRASRAVEAVDARPQAGRAEIGVARHRDEALARRFLLVGGDGVLEVAQHDVDLSGDVLDLGADFLVVRRHEMDHALEPHRQRAIGLGGADGEGRIKLRGVRLAAIAMKTPVLQCSALYWASCTCQRGAMLRRSAHWAEREPQRCQPARLWPARRRRRWREGWR